MNREIREMYMIFNLLLENEDEAIRVADGKSVQKVFVGCLSEDMERKELIPFDYIGFIYSDKQRLVEEIEFEKGLENE